MQVPVISRYLPGILIDPVKEYEVIWTRQGHREGLLPGRLLPGGPMDTLPADGRGAWAGAIVAGKMRRDLPWLVGWRASVLAGLGLEHGLYAGPYRPESSIINGFVAPLSFYPDSFTMIIFQLGMAIVTVFGLLFYFLRCSQEGQGEARAP